MEAREEVQAENRLTFIVDLKANRAHTFIRLQMQPHLMGHADDEVRDEAAG